MITEIYKGNKYQNILNTCQNDRIWNAGILIDLHISYYAKDLFHKSTLNFKYLLQNNEKAEKINNSKYRNCDIGLFKNALKKLDSVNHQDCVTCVSDTKYQLLLYSPNSCCRSLIFTKENDNGFRNTFKDISNIVVSNTRIFPLEMRSYKFEHLPPCAL